MLEGIPEEGKWQSLTVNNVSALTVEATTGDLYAATREDVEMSADGRVMAEQDPTTATSPVRNAKD